MLAQKKMLYQHKVHISILRTKSTNTGRQSRHLEDIISHYKIAHPLLLHINTPMMKFYSKCLFHLYLQKKKTQIWSVMPYCKIFDICVPTCLCMVATAKFILGQHS